MNKKTNEILEAIMNDSDVMARLENAADSQEVATILAEKGFNIEASQIDEFMAQQLGEGELNENDLDAVAGGAFKLRYLNPVYWVGRLFGWAASKNLC